MDLRGPAAIAALSLALAGAAHAGSISSAPVVNFYFGAGTQDACYVRNVGKRPLEVNVVITDAEGLAHTSSTDTCNGAPLAPDSACVVILEHPGGFMACTATTPGSARSLRGTLETRLNLNIVSAQDLR
jgi:hypothetical protein